MGWQAQFLRQRHEDVPLRNAVEVCLAYINERKAKRFSPSARLLGVPTEHRFLGFQWRRAGVEEIILLASLVDLTRHESGSAIWLFGVAFVAHHPPGPDKDMILVLGHFVLGGDFPDSLIEVIQFFNNSGADQSLW